MRITIGDNTKKCLDIFGIEYPFTYETLKTSYRKLLLKYHPDHNGDKEKTVEILKAYNTIKNLSININGQKKIIEEAEKDMFDFTEMCRDCNGIGHKIETIIRAPCLICNFFSRGFIIKICEACKGTGKFKQARSKRIVDCFKCGGVGSFKQKCWSCGGTGYIGKNETIKHFCFKCGGTGKIKLDPFNPVIPKGAIL